MRLPPENDPRTYLSDKTFNDLMDSQLRVVNGMIRDFKAIVPMLYVVCGPPDASCCKTVVIGLSEFTDMNKHSVIRSCGSMSVRNDGPFKDHMSPLLAILISEAWYSTGTVGVDKPVRPSDDPNRKEAVIVSGLSFDGRGTLVTIPVTRSSNGYMVPAEPIRTDVNKKNGEGNFLLREFWVGAALEYKRQQGISKTR